MEIIVENLTREQQEVEYEKIKQTMYKIDEIKNDLFKKLLYKEMFLRKAEEELKDLKFKNEDEKEELEANINQLNHEKKCIFNDLIEQENIWKSIEQTWKELVYHLYKKGNVGKF